MENEKYYLMDLERTLLHGTPAFWKITRLGYTYKIDMAGLFSHEIASAIVKGDYDQKTVMIAEKVLKRILAIEIES